jgi:hypothetical protein
MQNNLLNKVLRLAQPCSRRETAGWQVSQKPKRGFVSFEGFVTKKQP